MEPIITQSEDRDGNGSPPCFTTQDATPEEYERIFPAAHARHDEWAAEWAASRGLPPYDAARDGAR